MKSKFLIIVLTFVIFSYVTSIVHSQYINQVTDYFSKSRNSKYSYINFIHPQYTSLILLPIYVLINILIITLVFAIIYILFKSLFTRQNSNQEAGSSNNISINKSINSNKNISPISNKNISTISNDNDSTKLSSNPVLKTLLNNIDLQGIKPEELIYLLKSAEDSDFDVDKIKEIAKDKYNISPEIIDDLLEQLQNTTGMSPKNLYDKIKNLEKFNIGSTMKLAKNLLKQPLTDDQSNVSKIMSKFIGGDGNIKNIRNISKKNTIDKINNSKLIESKYNFKGNVIQDSIEDYFKSITYILIWCVFVILFQLIYFCIFLLLIKLNVIQKSKFNEELYVKTIIHHYITGFYISTSIIFLVVSTIYSSS